MDGTARAVEAVASFDFDDSGAWHICQENEAYPACPLLFLFSHQAHVSSGHVWQGRFKSPVVQDDDHALVVLRYIEANPLRAGLVTDLAQYPWSSYHVHGRGDANPLLSPLPRWAELGRSEAERQGYWRQWVHLPLTERELAAVRRPVTSGRPYGSVPWTAATAEAIGLRLTGRPRG